ncbi:MAG: Mut7-C RNAse domain-containing protein [Desulfobacterales bacterium]
MTARFAVEKTLGKLAKWLRLMGFDVCIESGAVAASEAATCPDRVVLTRTRRRCRDLRDRPFLFIRANDPFDQLREVICSLDLSRQAIRPFSRCLLCNTPTAAVDRKAVRHRVPDYVWESQARFCHCPRCGKIYWPGSHTRRGLAHIDSLFKAHRPPRLTHGPES